MAIEDVPWWSAARKLSLLPDVPLTAVRHAMFWPLAV
jgi:hypothetical protein